jgi:hypothetical protein
MSITYDDSTEIRQTFHFLESSTTSLCDPVFVMMMKPEHAGRVKEGGKTPRYEQPDADKRTPVRQRRYFLSRDGLRGARPRGKVAVPRRIKRAKALSTTTPFLPLSVPLSPPSRPAIAAESPAPPPPPVPFDDGGDSAARSSALWGNSLLLSFRCWLMPCPRRVRSVLWLICGDDGLARRGRTG